MAGTTDVYTKFTGATTIGDTSYNIHEDASNGYLYLGRRGAANTPGEIAHDFQAITSNGDAQTSQIVLSVQAQPTSSSTLQTNSSNIKVPNNGLIGFEAHFVAVESTTFTSTFIKAEGAVKNTGGAAFVGGGVTFFYVAEDTAGLHQLTIAVSVNDIVFTFKNTGNNSANGVCYVRYTQTFF